MAVERTFGIVKPNVVEDNNIGGTLKMIEDNGLVIKGMKMLQLSRPQAEEFYEVHKERPFFGELVDFMIRSAVVVFCVEGEDAVAKYRKVMGATNPAESEEGTIRKAYGKDVGENAVHGSDSLENAVREIGFFFPGMEKP